MRKLRVWRLLSGKRLQDVAREVRLPAYVVSAIERGEVVASARWAQRFEEAYGADTAAELLAPADLRQIVGPANGGAA